MENALKTTPLLLFLAFATASLAQQPNPFRRIGKTTEVIDVSHGKYVEIIEKDSLERVGTVIVNRFTRKIERFLNEDSLDRLAADNTAQSRFFSIDPLTAKFPYYSPYQFAGNTPIWASDLDGLEPNFRHKEDGINGVGLFDQQELGSIPRHQAVLTIGNPGKQFQIQWLLNNNGEAIGYLASRVVPDEEYKRLYGGSGAGLQAAYVISLDRFGKFAKNTDEYFDKSHNAELEDVMYGEIDRSPVKRLFDPRAWLAGRIIGAVGGLANEFLLARLLPLQVTESGIIVVTRHLAQFDAVENNIMIGRLKKIASGELKATEIDMNFYKHELRESELMKKGMSYDEAHEKTLKEQGMYERGYEKKLYTEDALKAGNEQMKKDANNK